MPHGVKRSVSQFNPDSGELIQTFESITEAAQKTKIDIPAIHSAASGRTYYAGGYIWSFEDPKTFTPPTRKQIERKKFENRSRALRSVSQFDRNTGKFIRTFESITEAAQKTKIDISQISRAASGKIYDAGGYIWTYQDPNNFTPPTREQVEQKKFENRSRALRRVSQFHPDTGELIRTFEHAGEAQWETGVNRITIRKAASGKMYYAGGYIWTYEDPKTFTPPTREQVERKKFENRSRAHIGRRPSQATRDKMRKNAARQGGTPKSVLQYTVPNLEFVQEHPSIRQAGQIVKCSPPAISTAVSDKHPNRLTAAGYYWSDHLLTEQEKQVVREKLLKSPRFKKLSASN